MPLKLSSNLNLDNVIKNLGQKQILVPHIDMAIGQGDFVWNFDYEPKQGDNAWHPSGDCTPSLYELYQKTSQPQQEQIGPALRKIFMIGHFYHQYLQWVIERRLEFCGPDDVERRGIKGWGFYPRDESSFRPYHWATGSADICPCVIPGEGEFIVDFKTAHPRLYATGMNPDYLAKWECQGNIYMDFFDMERALFIIIDKSNGDMKELVFERNQPLVDAIYTKWKIVGACLEEGIEPPEEEHIELPLRGPST